MENKSLIILVAVVAVVAVAGVCIITLNNNPTEDSSKASTINANADADGYATISDNAIADSMKGSTESLEIDVKGDNAVGVKISKASVKILSESKSSITICVNNGAIELDNAALKGLDTGKDMVLSLNKINADDLTPKQAIAADGCSVIMSAELTQDSTPIHGLNGKATITSAYTLKEGEDAKDIQTAYISDDGSMEVVESSYADGIISVTVEHLSVFAVFFEDVTKKTFTVTFESNGGSPVNPETVKYGEKAVKPSDPTKEPTTFSVYTFAGWFVDPELTEPYDFSKSVYGDLQLYASWDVKWLMNAVTIAKAFADSYDGLFRAFTLDESSTEMKATVSNEYDTGDETPHGVFKSHINFILTDDDEMFKTGKDLIDASNHKRMRIEKEMVDTGSDNIYACIYQRVHHGGERAMLLFAMYEDNVYVETNLEVYEEDFILSPESLVTREDIMEVFNTVHECIQQFKLK